MLVRFTYWRGGERQSSEWTLDAVPRIGDYVHVEDSQGEVTAVSWLLNTQMRPSQAVEVFLDKSNLPRGDER